MAEPYYADETVTLYLGDSLGVLKELPDGSVDCCVTSPPYFGLRDYGTAGQYGLEDSPAEYVETMRAVFAEVRRVLVDDGTLWLNIGDSYTGSWGNQGRKQERGTQRPIHGGMIQPVHDGRYPDAGTRTGSRKPGDPGPKNMLGIPWRVALALQDDEWILRNDVIWRKPNAMPSSVTDRLNNTYEHVFLFSKSRKYWFDLDPIRVPLAHPDAADGTRVFGGKTGGQGKVGSSYRTNGGVPHVYGEGPSERAASRRARNGHTNKPNSVSTAWVSGEKGRNPGDVWTIPTQPFAAAHFACMAPALAERCIQSGCKPSGTVLDPFSGSGTTGLAAARHGRRYVGIDLSAEYLDLSLQTRLADGTLPFEEAADA